MSSVSQWRRASALLLVLATPYEHASAQTTLEYAHRVDSLARVWQTAVATHVVNTTRDNAVPANVIQVGSIKVFADSQWADLARNVAERLAPLASRTYGKF